MFIHEVCAALDQAKVPYAVVGGYAVALHGIIRGTVDVDMVISWTLKHLRDAEAALESIGLKSTLPVDSESVFQFREEYIHRRNMIAWHFYHPLHPGQQVDLIINFNLNTAHVKKIKTPEGTIKILAKNDLIQMKKASGRPQDLEDVKALEAL